MLQINSLRSRDRHHSTQCRGPGSACEAGHVHALTGCRCARGCSLQPLRRRGKIVNSGQGHDGSRVESGSWA